MRLTSALYLHRLLAKLNPAAPRTVRESQQLLNVLESSFRKRLDETYPAPSQTSPEDPTQQAIPLNSTDSSSNAAQHYLHSLLTHPLLDARPEKQNTQTLLAKTALQCYQNAFIQGTITIDLLQTCLKDYCNGLRKREKISKDDRLGPRLATWLHSANPQMKQSFFFTQSLFDRALTIMAADNQERALWDWLRMVYEREFDTNNASANLLTSARWLAIEDDLVSTLMRFSIRKKKLDDAAQQFTQACQYRSESGRADAMAQPESSKTQLFSMTSSWKRLAASIILTRKQHGIPTEQYDAVLRYALPWEQHPYFNDAILMIYHPLKPSAELLCKKLRQTSPQDSFTKAIKDSVRKMNKAVLVTILDGAQLSLQHKKSSDAKLLLDFARANYPDHVPTNKAEHNMSLDQRMQTVWETLHVLQTQSLHPGLV